MRFVERGEGVFRNIGMSRILGVGCVGILYYWVKGWILKGFMYFFGYKLRFMGSVNVDLDT